MQKKKNEVIIPIFISSLLMRLIKVIWGASYSSQEPCFAFLIVIANVYSSLSNNVFIL